MLDPKSCLRPDEGITITPIKPIPITTANGLIMVTKQATVFIEDLQLYVDIVICNSSPLLLSLGLLCATYCSFFWRFQKEPLLVIHKEDGKDFEELGVGQRQDCGREASRRRGGVSW